jgi:Flp pilus assembly protein TadG
VELVFASALLFFACMAVIEFGRVSMLRHSCENAAYEAARAAIVPGATPAMGEAAGRDYLARLQIHDAVVRITPFPIREDTKHVTAEVAVPVHGNTWALPRFTRGRVIRSSVTLLTERVPLVQAHGLSPAKANPLSSTAPAHGKSVGLPASKESATKRILPQF